MGKWIGVVGESHANDDGSSRQAEIARCSVGEPVRLRHRPDNRFDTNCIEVLSARGVQIGVLSREHAAVFAPHFRAGHQVEAEIAKINGGTAGKPSRGVVIEVDVDEDDFEDTLEVVRERGLAAGRHNSSGADKAAPTDLKVYFYAILGIVLLLILIF